MRPISYTFFGYYVLLFSLAVLARGLWGFANVGPVYGGLLCAGGVWGAFCSVGALLRDGPCRRGVLWFDAVAIAAILSIYVQAYRGNGLEYLFTDIGLTDLAIVANVGLLLAALFHLSSWRALEATGEAHGH